MKRRFVGHGKFWRIALEGRTLTENAGRAGTLGAFKTRKFASPKAAEAEALRLIERKRAQGYREPKPPLPKPAPDSVRGLFDRANALVAAGDVAAALPLLDAALGPFEKTKAVSKHDVWTVGPAFTLRGVCRQALKKPGFLADFKRAVPLYDFGARAHLVEHYCFVEPDFKRAVSYFESALPDAGDLVFRYVKGIGVAALMTGDLELAQNEYTFLLENDEFASAKHKARMRADLDAMRAKHRTVDFEPLYRLLRGEKAAPPPQPPPLAKGKTTAKDWVLWTYDRSASKRAGRVRGIENVDREYELAQGVPREKGFPASARATMQKKGHTTFTDNLDAGALILASPRLTSFLKARALKNVEFLPLQLFEADGTLASRGHRLVHPVRLQDCLDVKASKPSYNEIIRTHIDWVKRLVIDPKKIQGGVELFRMKGLTRPVVVHRALAEALMREGFKGLCFTELRDFNED